MRMKVANKKNIGHKIRVVFPSTTLIKKINVIQKAKNKNLCYFHACECKQWEAKQGIENIGI